MVLLMIPLFSCVTQRRCLSKFPPVSDTITVVTTKDSVIYRDTTIYIKIPGAVQVDSILIPCPSVQPGVFIPDTAFLENQFSIARAWYRPPNIQLRLIQKDTTIAFRLDSAIREAHYWKEQYTQVTQTVTKKHIPVLYKIALWAWIGAIIFVLALILIRRR